MPSSLSKVRGFADNLGPSLKQHRRIISKALAVAERFGFEEVETPIMEQEQLFKRGLADTLTDVSKEMYIFEKNKERLALRPEGTAGIARLFITEKMNRSLPLRFSYSGPMFRYERPQKGRLRQFTSVGLELLGERDEEADIEICCIAHLFLKELNLDSKISFEINSLGSFEERQNYIKDLVKYFTPFQSRLSPESQIRLKKNPLRLLDSQQEEDQDILKKAPHITRYLKSKSQTTYCKIKERLQELDIKYVENPYLVRGLDYYNDFVFEIKSSELGSQSTLLAGGRYDSLISKLGGSETPAVGWGAGVERLALLLKTPPTSSIDIGIVAQDKDTQKQAYDQAYKLRKQGYKVYARFTGNFSKQMSRLSKASCSLALIFGKKEAEQNMVSCKNLQNKKQELVSLENLPNYIKAFFN